MRELENILERAAAFAAGGVIDAADLMLGPSHASTSVDARDRQAVDSEGGYWATLVYAGRLRRYLPDGTLDKTSTAKLFDHYAAIGSTGQRFCKGPITVSMTDRKSVV